MLTNQNSFPPYQPGFLQFNGHLQTIIPGLFRKAKKENLKRERWETPDGDFIDVDWLINDGKRLAIISHGLEGDSRRPYMLGMASKLYGAGFTVLNWNFRSCSGEINRKLRFYHSGSTDDLHFIVENAILKSGPSEVYLIGFSLGGNLTLKYLGEDLHYKDPRIKKAIAISVPIDLSSSSVKMKSIENRFYEIRFLRSLKSKVRIKEKLIPGSFDLQPLYSIKHLWEFDDLYTGPLHGFQGAQDYYNQCSSIHFLKGIQIKTLLINARNDPFLSELCYPQKPDHGNDLLETYYTSKGGHCGFATAQGSFWTEDVTLEFLKND